MGPSLPDVFASSLGCATKSEMVSFKSLPSSLIDVEQFHMIWGKEKTKSKRISFTGTHYQMCTHG